MMDQSMAIRHFLQFSDFSTEEHEWIFQRAAVIKRKFKNYEKYHPLADRTLAMIFEKASTRTRVSFEADTSWAARWCTSPPATASRTPSPSRTVPG